MSAFTSTKGTSKKAVRTDEFREAPKTSSHKKRIAKSAVTLMVAAAADALQVAFLPLEIPIDIVTALIFFMLWGFRWEILAVLMPEMIPGIDFIPGWTALALYLSGQSIPKKPAVVVDIPPARPGD